MDSQKKGVVTMRDILYKKRKSFKNHRETISVSEYSSDKECETRIRKSLVCIATRVQEVGEQTGQPEIYVKKSFDTKLRQENFSFRVKGFFFLTRKCVVFRVDFCHTLRINIVWKNKSFFPTGLVASTQAAVEIPS